MKKRFAAWEIFGFVFIMLAGSLFHFMYEFLWYSPIAGAFFAVNESLWEHLKLVFLPAFIFAVFEFFFADARKFPFFFTAKFVSVLVMMGVITGGFYLYKIFMDHNLFMDILLMVTAVVSGQILSYKLSLNFEKKGNLSGFLLLVALGAIFAVFTFYPPHIFLFRDEVLNFYGLSG